MIELSNTTTGATGHDFARLPVGVPVYQRTQLVRRLAFADVFGKSRTHTVAVPSGAVPERHETGR